MGYDLRRWFVKCGGGTGWPWLFGSWIVLLGFSGGAILQHKWFKEHTLEFKEWEGGADYEYVKNHGISIFLMKVGMLETGPNIGFLEKHMGTSLVFLFQAHKKIKVVLLLDQLSTAKIFTNRLNPTEKYIQVVTVDG